MNKNTHSNENSLSFSASESSLNEVLFYSSASGYPVVIPGNALVVDERMQFRALAKFGNTFLQRFQGPNSIEKIWLKFWLEKQLDIQF